MTAGLSAIVPTLIPLLGIIAMFVAAIIAHRGKKFWGTWCMIIGSGIALVGILGSGLGIYLLISSSSAGSTSDFSAFAIISGIASLGSGVGFLTFIAGLIGLCTRWGAASRRAAELEQIVASIHDRQNPQNPPS
ncbi:MAG: hypothetical protein AAGC74_14415 [Verrucomicrobiota bacterium]